MALCDLSLVRRVAQCGILTDLGVVAEEISPHPETCPCEVWLLSTTFAFWKVTLRCQLEPPHCPGLLPFRLAALLLLLWRQPIGCGSGEWRRWMGVERVHESCLDCQAEPEDRNIKKGAHSHWTSAQTNLRLEYGLKTSLPCQNNVLWVFWVWLGIGVHFFDANAHSGLEKWEKSLTARAFCLYNRLVLSLQLGWNQESRIYILLVCFLSHTVSRQHLAVKHRLEFFMCLGTVLRVGFVTYKASLFFIFFSSSPRVVAGFVALYSLNWNTCHTARLKSWQFVRVSRICPSPSCHQLHLHSAELSRTWWRCDCFLVFKGCEKRRIFISLTEVEFFIFFRCIAFF